MNQARNRCLAIIFVIIAGGGARAESLSGGFYSARIGGTQILEFDQKGGPFPPDTVVSLSQDKAVQFTPLQSPPSGGDSQTVASIIIGGGTVPTIDVEIDTTLRNVPISSQGLAEASLQYSFAAFRRYLWSPGTSIPVKVTMAALARASEPNATATASASMGYHTPEGLLFLEVTARTQGTGGEEVTDEETVTLGIAPDFSNSVSLSASTLVSATPNPTGTYTGTYSALALADPRIRIDPAVFVNVEGFLFPAADVYGLTFSDGFYADEPPPNPILYVASGTQAQVEAGVPLITGTKTVTKIGAGTAVLDLENTFTGTTSIQQGVLAITNASAISRSPLVGLSSGASFDVSGLSTGYTVPSGQTIGGSGTVLGSVTFGAGSTLSPGMLSAASGASMLGADMQAGSRQARVVPEPATLGLVGAGLGFLGLGALRRKRVA